MTNNENPKLVTAERAREIVELGGSVHRDERFTFDFKYIVDTMPAELAHYAPSANPTQGMNMPPSYGHTYANCSHRSDFANIAEHDRDCPYDESLGSQ